MNHNIDLLNLELERFGGACAALKSELNALAANAKAGSGAIEGTLLLRVAEAMRDAAERLRTTADVMVRDRDGAFQTRNGGDPE